jgi:hypothetical protein
MMSNKSNRWLTLAACVLAMAGCEADDSMPTRPRKAQLLIPNDQAEENAEKRVLEQGRPTPASPVGPGQSDSRSRWDRSVVTLQSGGAAPAPATGNPSNNPFNDMLRALGYEGPNDWDAFGNTRGPMNEYKGDPYPASMTHIPANPGSTPLPGVVPIPSGEWSVENSWGQGMVLQSAAHRPWPEVRVNYRTGEVKHNPVYYFNVRDHLQVKKYIADYQRDLETQNFQSQWFYWNSAGMPVWVLLEPPEMPYVSPQVQKVERQIPESFRDGWKNDAYEVPWFFVQTVTLPLWMMLEPPLVQRISQAATSDPNYLGHLPTEGPVVPAPIPGKLRWDYPFLNPDGTVKPMTPLALPPSSPSTVPSPAPRP